MEYCYPVTYLGCRSCVSKSHCAQCAARAEETLRRSPAVESVTVDLRQGTVRIAGGDEDALLDLLEGAGLFAG